MTPVGVLDACVLYPAAQRDLFMWLAAGGAIRTHWTNKIHDEWMRNVGRDYGVPRSELEKIAQLMNRAAAGDALISRYRQHERYANERLLHRLSLSPHRNRFVLKGAMLMTTWFDVMRPLELLFGGGRLWRRWLLPPML